ncbi:MAG: signal peptidase I [Planctomycetota bacterium]
MQSHVTAHTVKARKSKPRRKLRAILWTLALLAITALVVRVFVADVYPVSSSSMRPTIFGGSAAVGGELETEWVLVTYDRSPPERYELLVLRPENGGEPLVKRALGLPGEVLRLSHGDLYIDGNPLGSIASGGPLIPLWDTLYQPWSEWWSSELGSGKAWHDDNGALVLNALGSGVVSPRLFAHKQARDGYLSPEGEREPGLQPVNDLVLELDFTLEQLAEDGQVMFVVTLTEGGDAFSLYLRVNDSNSSGFEALLLRSTLAVFESGTGVLDDAGELLASAPLSLSRKHTLSFSNIDNELRFDLDGKTVISARYERNRPLDRMGVASEHVAPRVAMFGSGLQLRFDRLRLLRDLYWFPMGSFGVDQELVLGPDEVFVLGDNSRASTDSRSFGPLSLSRIGGRVKSVLWPFSRRRDL